MDFISRRDGDADGQAPQAHLLVVHAVDGLVGPDGLGGGERLRVVVVGRGVNGQGHIALAVVAVHQDFAGVQPGAVALRIALPVK